MTTLHIIEDDAEIVRLLEHNLKVEGYRVNSSRDGREGLSAVLSERPDIVLLDLRLPSMDGLEICQRIRRNEATANTPIIMISVKGQESDVVGGLNTGADDYITKPFSVNELLARIRALRRRSEVKPAARERLVVVGSLRIDPLKHSVELGGRALSFTATEFKLLYTLAASPGRVFTREMLKLEAIGDDVEVMDHNIDVHVASIRRKLGESRVLIQTVWGVGYRFAEEGEEPEAGSGESQA
jgi:two-component system phosphate regulon response regulator PhoB